MKVLVFTLIALISLPLYAFDLKKVEFISCYDGDTCKFNILDNNFPKYLNPMLIRVYGIDTKEIKSKNPKDKEKALLAKEFTINFIKSAKNLKLKNCIKDKYFRFDCDYINNGKSLKDELIKQGLAVPYFGGKKN